MYKDSLFMLCLSCLEKLKNRLLCHGTNYYLVASNIIAKTIKVINRKFILMTLDSTLSLNEFFRGGFFV